MSDTGNALVAFLQAAIQRGGRRVVRAAVPFAVPPDAEDLHVLAQPVVRIKWPVSDQMESGTVYPLGPRSEFDDAKSATSWE